MIRSTPAAFLAENQRRGMHWAQYASALAEERTRLYYLVLEALHGSRPRFERFSIAFTFLFADQRKRDRDNLVARLKPLMDVLGTDPKEQMPWKGFAQKVALNSHFLFNCQF